MLNNTEFDRIVREKDESVLCSQAEAARVLSLRFGHITRQRVNQYLNHPEHSKLLRRERD